MQLTLALCAFLCYNTIAQAPEGVGWGGVDV